MAKIGELSYQAFHLLPIMHLLKDPSNENVLVLVRNGCHAAQIPVVAKQHSKFRRNQVYEETFNIITWVKYAENNEMGRLM